MSTSQELHFDQSPVLVILPQPESVPTGLGIVRALGRKGSPVIAASSEHSPPSFLSRYVNVRLACPSPSESGSEFVEWLADVSSRIQPKPVLFIASDHDALLVNSYQELLEEVLLYPFISREALDCCLLKDRTVKVAQQAGVAAPNTWLADSTEDTVQLLDEVQFPCVVKPSAWVEFDGVAVRQRGEFRDVFGSKALRASSPDMLGEVLAQTRRMNYPMVIQEEIKGPSDQIFGASVYVKRDFELGTVYTCRKTRQLPSDFGSGTMVEGMVLPEVTELCARLCRAAGFHGVAELEFKRDGGDGQLKIMEINPRPGTWISAAPASNANTPYAAYCDLTGAGLPDEIQTDEIVRWCDGWPDFEYFLKYRKGDHTGAPLPLSKYLRTRKGRYEYAYYAPEDPRPSLRRLRTVTQGLLRRVVRKLHGTRRSRMNITEKQEDNPLKAHSQPAKLR